MWPNTLALIKCPTQCHQVHRPLVMVSFIVNLTQPRVTWEEGVSTEGPCLWGNCLDSDQHWSPAPWTHKHRWCTGVWYNKVSRASGPPSSTASASAPVSTSFLTSLKHDCDPEVGGETNPFLLKLLRSWCLSLPQPANQKSTPKK